VTINVSAALSDIPVALREPLLTEYRSLVQNFLEQRWRPTELSGALFSEIVYTILDGHAKEVYANKPAKPSNFVTACRKLEESKKNHVPRSFQILIPRMLPALYEVRNNRSVGHVGGDVDPNHMDSVVVLSMCNWIMGELVRVFHNVSVIEAQAMVDAIAEARIPIIWTKGNLKRVLNPKLSLDEHILLLTSSSVPSTSSQLLKEWVEYGNSTRFKKALRALHKQRLIEFDESTDNVEILPPGTVFVQTLIRAKKLTFASTD
jgi:hypothetical protein